MEGRSQAATLAACGGLEEPGWPVCVKEGSWEVSEATPCCVSVCVCVLGLGDGPIHCKVGIFFHIRKLRLIEVKVIQLARTQPSPSISNLKSFLVKKSLSF